MDDNSYSVKACRGLRSGVCPCLVHVPGLDPQGLAGAVARTIEEQGWPGHVEHPTPAHARFKVALAGCANGCSLPHIREVGLILARHPHVDQDSCNGCGICAMACPEGSISLASGKAVVDDAACLSCSRCIAICAREALHGKVAGLRLAVGGRMGRKPRLARDLPGIHDLDQALEILARRVRLRMGRDRAGPGED